MSINNWTQEELDAEAAEMRKTMTAILSQIIEIKKMLPRLEELQSEYRRHFHNYSVMFGELDER
jgi:predicted  nucleic acid-binding Zn-ribbon protein